MRFHPDCLRRPVPLVAAIVLSAGAHGALVLIAGTRAPLEASIASSAAIRGDAAAAPLRARFRAAAPTVPTTSPTPAIAATRRAAIGPQMAVQRSMRETPVEVAATAPQPTAIPAGDGDERVERPVPLTYPVIALPPDDDPHRVGLVRLMLVVSSEGSVVRSFVIASALSEDYVDRIQRSFEQMRFLPAVARGLPRAGWYEVAVNFEFDPDARSMP